MLDINQFDYNLPQELIAAYPLPVRDSSRMLVLEKKTGSVSIVSFRDIGNYLAPGDCLVLNNTKVIKARLFGIKEGGTARIEAMLIGMDAAVGAWKCYLKPGKRIQQGSEILLVDGSGRPSGFSYRVLAKNIDGSYLIEFNVTDIHTVLEECGHVPLPPYIKRTDEPDDENRYQTVYSSIEGAVAAPTAGLHFTDGILEKLMAKGVIRAELTLHVGAGTFKPVTVEKISDHKMHEEEFILDRAAAETINGTKKNGGKVLAVGTTTARVLETLAGPDGLVKAQAGRTGIFIYPPYKPKVVDILLTNFHLPKSTLLMLVSAFAGIENIRNAYSIAIREKMRFYSYGDCMLII